MSVGMNVAAPMAPLRDDLRLCATAKKAGFLVDSKNADERIAMIAQAWEFGVDGIGFSDGDFAKFKVKLEEAYKSYADAARKAQAGSSSSKNPPVSDEFREPERNGRPTFTYEDCDFIADQPVIPTKHANLFDEEGNPKKDLPFLLVRYPEDGYFTVKPPSKNSVQPLAAGNTRTISVDGTEITLTKTRDCYEGSFGEGKIIITRHDDGSAATIKVTTPDKGNANACHEGVNANQEMRFYGKYFDPSFTSNSGNGLPYHSISDFEPDSSEREMANFLMKISNAFVDSEQHS